MKHIAYRYDIGQRCIAENLSMFNAALELLPGEVSAVNPVRWSTSPDFIHASFIETGQLISEHISRDYSFWASWPSISVYLIYNGFDGNYSKQVVQYSTMTQVRNSDVRGFKCWLDEYDKQHFPESLISASGSINLRMSCCYDVKCSFDMNGGHMRTGVMPQPLTMLAS